MQDEPARFHDTSAAQDGVSAATVPTSPANPLDQRWYVHVDGKTGGPYGGRDIDRLVRGGQIRGTDFLCVEGGSEWVEACNEPAFRSLFAAAVQSPIRPLGVAPAAAKVYAANPAKLRRAGLVSIGLGLLGLVPLWQLLKWHAGGAMPDARAFFALFALLFLPFGVLCFIASLRRLPRLTIEPHGIKLDNIIGTKWANWDSLEPFTIKTRVIGRAKKKYQTASAKVTGNHASRSVLRAKAFPIPDFFLTPIETVAAELNAARAAAVGASDLTPVSSSEADEAPIGLASFKLPWVTFALLAVLIGVFIIENKFAVTPSVNLTPSLATLIAMGGLSHAAVLSGEWYRLFTSALLHANLAHLAGNGVALLLGGWLLERLVGRVWLFAFFAIGALGGSLLSLAVGPPNLISVGASGALMGLFAALFVGSFRAPSGTWTRQRLQINSLRILVPSLLPLFSSSSVGRIDYGAHFGGAISGAVLAALLLKFWPPTERIPQLRKVAAGIAMIGAILFVASAGMAVANYSRYDIVLIPPAELPKNAADRQARAADLAARYPDDPRSHLFLGEALAAAKDTAGAERELRLALATVQAHNIFGPQTELAIRTVLASFLAQQGRLDEAKDIARPTCAAPAANAAIDKLRKGLTDMHLCN
jgi:rhomboid protease GluP